MKYSLLKYSLLIVACMFLSPPSFASDMIDGLKSLPVQDAGRIKPFESLARESLQLIYGRQTYKKRSAAEVVFTWMIVPDEWDKTPLVEVSHAGLRDSLKLTDKKNKHFTPIELMGSDRVGLHISELKLKQSRKEKLDSFYQAVKRLNSQLNLYHAFKLGIAVRVAPNKESSDTSWTPVGQLKGAPKEAFKKLTEGFAQSVLASVKGGVAEPTYTVEDFTEAITSYNEGEYFDASRVKAELWLHKFEPFQKAALFYLLSMFVMAIAYFSEKKWIYRTAWGFVILGFLLHTCGFLVRVYIVQRPPVSNMYETVIWAAWGTVFFSFILEFLYKKKIILMAAAFVAAGCLLMASLAPTVLDPSLQPLEAVLRSTFWLVTHVMLIVISYGAFFLAWAIGNLNLVTTLIGEEKYKQQIKDGSQAIYRSVQIGVVLLALGTILGGVWADYSWGRFWGWDPKETWALIALLGYLAVLHAKVAGLIKNFGLSASAVAAFSLVIMAWYGVNFWLGAGLHSYGFGAGGIEKVAIVVIIQLLFVLFVAGARYIRNKP